MLNGLPNIDTIKDLITGSFSDKLKAFIEPHALVNAAIFLTLNLALVFPTVIPDLDRTPNPFLTSILNLSSSWQIVLFGLALLLLSYGLNTLGNFFLGVASGDVFRNTPVIDWILRSNQERAYNQHFQFIQAQYDESEEPNAEEKEKIENERNQMAYRFAYQYPVMKSELGLTALGNVLINPSSYIFHQYGASSELIWPIIQDKLGENDKTAKLVQENWVSLLFLSSLEILLLIVCFELVLATGFAHVAFPWLKILVLLLGAVLCYYIALEKARQWGSSLRRVFDLKINVAFSELGMKALGNLTPADAGFKSSWSSISSWLAYGAHINALNVKKIAPQNSWYDSPQAENWPQVKAPEFLQVESVKPSMQYVGKKTGSNWLFFEVKVYTFAITNKSVGDKALTGASSYLVVMDQLKSNFNQQSVQGKLLINADPDKPKNALKFDEVEVTGIRDPSAHCLALAFPLGDIPAGSSRILQYHVDKRLVAQLTVTPPDSFSDIRLGADKPAGIYILTFVPGKASKNKITIMAENFVFSEFAPEMKVKELPSISGTPDPNIGNRKMTWNLPASAIQGNAEIYLEMETEHE